MIVFVTGRPLWGVENVRAAGVVSARQKIITNEGVEGYRNRVVQSEEKLKQDLRLNARNIVPAFVQRE